MSLIGLVNLAERLLNQSSSENQQSQVPQKKTTVQTKPTTHGVAEDQFNLSPQNGQAQNSAQDAGLFSVAQISFFSAAAEFLLGQTAAPTANQTAQIQAPLPSETANGAAAIPAAFPQRAKTANA
jgi:hypothetical protein